MNARWSNRDWTGTFEALLERPKGLTQREWNKFVQTVVAPLSNNELDWLLDECGWDARDWVLPGGPLPDSYQSLMMWSNGGAFRNGKRLFHMFPALDRGNGVRAMMLMYGVPSKTPGFLPFAFNGGGVFYGFDMRAPPFRGEYPILAASCGIENEGDLVAPTLLAALKGRSAVDESW